MSLPPLVEPAEELSVDEVRRYSRHLIIPDVGMTGQKRLKNAKVLVIGAGGLGSPALLYLAAAGSTISVTQLEQMLKERDNGERDFVLVDVREQNEFEINRIPGSVLIPKGDFLNGSAFDELSRLTSNHQQLVLHCKSGVRSAEALAVAKGAGYADAVHVGGGVVAWVNQIDPSQPSY